MPSSKRITLSLPGHIVDDIDHIASRLGISRSAFVAQMLADAQLSHVRALLSSLPEEPTEGDTRRFRGESRRYVKERMDSLQNMQGGLFDDPTE